MQSLIVAPTSIFQSLSDQTRLRIIRLLCSFPSEDFSLCDLSDSMLQPEYNISRHIKILRQAGLISSTKEGRWVYHRIVGETPLLKDLYKFVVALPDDECFFKEDEKRLKKRLLILQKTRCVKEPFDDRENSMK